MTNPHDGSPAPCGTSRATIQSFDWRTIRLARRLDPRIQTWPGLISEDPDLAVLVARRNGLR